MFLVAVIFFTSLHCSILASAEGGNGTKFVHVQERCYAADWSIWQPPLSKRVSNKTVRALLGVESKRTCAVECAVDESCAAFQHFPDTNTCVFASACYFKFLWTKGENCSTQIVEGRMKNDSQCYLDDFALVAAYNLRLGNLNLVNATQYAMTVDGAVFTDEGAEIGGAKKLTIPTLSNELPLSDGFAYGKTFSIWARVKFNPLTAGYDGIFETCSCTAGYYNYRVRVYIYTSTTEVTSVSMFLKDGLADKEREEKSTLSYLVSSDGWFELSLVFDGARFTLYLDGTLITQRTTETDTAETGADMDMNCTYVGRYNTVSHPIEGLLDCFGIAYTNLSAAQLSAVYNKYCYV